MDIVDVIRAARAQGRSALDEPAAKAALAGSAIPVPRGGTASEPDEAVRVAEGLTPPLVVKLLSADALHKSDVGGVRVGLRTADEVRAAAEGIREAARTHGVAFDGVLVEEMAPAGTELVVGGFCDARFGPVVMVGLGGILVELFADVAFRICPIDERDARDMLAELRAAPLLDGLRGQVGVNRRAVVDALLHVGGRDGLLYAHAAEIAEIDINPLIASPDGAVAADARVVLHNR